MDSEIFELKRTLRATRGNIAETARILGVRRNTVRKWIKSRKLTEWLATNYPPHPSLVGPRYDRSRTSEQLFWDNVDKSGGPDACWPWKRSRRAAGYGRVVRDGKSTTASKIAWELAHGRKMFEGLEACHKCHNPPCCNPAHLYAGTRQQNVDDTAASGRRPKGSAVPAARLNDAAVCAVAEWAEEGMLQRQIAERLGVRQTTIGLVLRGECWKHVPRKVFRNGRIVGVLDAYGRFIADEA